MKQLLRLMGVLFASSALATGAFAGSEMYSGKETKAVAPAPLPECNWTGFYIGLNIGGQFGHSENKDLDDYWFENKPWGYSESGIIGGGQVGYNFQWNWLVLGAEFDGGYMNLDGDGFEPGTNQTGGPNRGSSDSDFYTTLRGRVGVAFNHWLFYGTGGGIGVNYETRMDDNPEALHGHKQDFDWGYTVGGGIEYMLGCHWSVKAEYLYFALDKQRFNGVWPASTGGGDTRYHFDGNTEGNIVRAGLNYKF
jgi:outer membrane immunogenic protein